MVWTVYLARCADGSLYTGITTHVERRLAQHNRGKGAAYTRSRLPLTLAYCEQVKDRARALRREHAIRKLTRLEKEALASEWDRYGALRSAPAYEEAAEVRRSAPA